MSSFTSAERSVAFPPSLSHIANYIEETDNDGTLRIISYKFCDPSTPNEVLSIRGAVYTCNGDTLLFKSSHIPEYNENDDITKILSTIPYDAKNPSKMFYFPSEEGTMIRVFNFETKWYVSTHRRLDAFKSKWCGKESYGDIFKRSLEFLGINDLDAFLETLDKTKVYFFFVRNTHENRIVCNAPQNPMLYYIGSLDYNGKFNLVYTFRGANEAKDSSLLGKVPRLESIMFKSYGQVFKYVRETDPLVRQGLIIIREDGKQVKILNSKYQLYSQVRGNEASIKFRYLNVRTNPVYSRMLAELYPEFIPSFTLYENTIYKVAKNIHTTYMERFIKKQHVVTDKLSYRIIKEAHSRHLANRNFKVTLDIILNILSEQRYCSTLNALIKQELNPAKTTDDASIADEACFDNLDSEIDELSLEENFPKLE
jgi:hypothetical protein